MSSFDLYFSEHFDVDPAVLDEYGAFDVSIVSDLPLFVDPFLLFNSDKAEYQALHERILKYLFFLRDKATPDLDPALVKSWYRFKEVKQNWLGFTLLGNGGSGLGGTFATSLHASLGSILSSFGSEQITASAHLEKLALIRPGVGRDELAPRAGSQGTVRELRAYCSGPRTTPSATLGPERRCLSRPRRIPVTGTDSARRTLPWLSLGRAVRPDGGSQREPSRLWVPRVCGGCLDLCGRGAGTRIRSGSAATNAGGTRSVVRGKVPGLFHGRATGQPNGVLAPPDVEGESDLTKPWVADVNYVRGPARSLDLCGLLRPDKLERVSAYQL